MLELASGREVDMGSNVVEAIDRRRAGVDVGSAPAVLQPLLEAMLRPDPAARLRSMGISIAIDDFGIGYSSMAYLRELPVDKFKIDRAFMSAVPASASDTRLAAALIAMGHTLQVGLVAEGVETQEQFDFLRTHGCHEAQGHFLGKPMPASELEAMIRAQNPPAAVETEARV